MNTVLVDAEIVTPFGLGIGACWSALLSGRTAIAPLARFDTHHFTSRVAAVLPGMGYGDESLVSRMLHTILAPATDRIPADALVILATTTGEVDRLERAVLDGTTSAPPQADPIHLLNTVREMCASTEPGMLISAACASSTSAFAVAGDLIRSGRRSAVLIVACDAVTEFVFSGFSALMALDTGPARPFDRNRKGLSVGEAAGYALLMSNERAYAERREIRGELLGWGMSNDANHMTGPSRDGLGLARAIEAALESADAQPHSVASVCAHGTGTAYNDSMEMKAFRTVFGEQPVPAYSVKGAIGHTMGAAGLVEALLTLQSMRQRVIPPTVGLQNVDDEALGWVSAEPADSTSGSCAISTNSGFGGINAALVLR